jgi:hypothetical protein
MTKDRINISLDSEIAKQMRHAAVEKYGDSKSFSTLIEDLFKEMNNNLVNTDIKAPMSEGTDIDSTAKHEESKLELEDMVRKMIKNYIPINMPPSTVQKLILAYQYLESHNEKICCEDPLLVWTLGCTKCGEKIGTLPELPWTPERAIVRIKTELDNIDDIFNYEKIAEECKEMGDPIPEFPAWAKGNHIEDYRQELIEEIIESKEQIEKINETLGKMCIEIQEGKKDEEPIGSIPSPTESQVDSKDRKGSNKNARKSKK